MALNMKGLETFRAGLPDAMHTAGERTANQVADVERQLVPVDEGDLRDTIRVEDGEQEGEWLVKAGDPSAKRQSDGRPVDYAPHVNYGTATSPAQPFVEPAAAEIDPAIEYRAELQKLARRSTL